MIGFPGKTDQGEIVACDECEKGFKYSQLGS